ncbi:hypothetical protein NHX12_013821 [Muraenolepis orangiensis]|uniref:Uncharacterized protein n=1 Tax=Muraenolepis orangiensis TaxID=630683 RepID=A0A9Q0I408_9TELE|nr:hypothetical protein NHX12_013821 [Muraenolepis orangiensis]
MERNQAPSISLWKVSCGGGERGGKWETREEEGVVMVTGVIPEEEEDSKRTEGMCKWSRWIAGWSVSPFLQVHETLLGVLQPVQVPHHLGDVHLCSTRWT